VSAAAPGKESAIPIASTPNCGHAISPKLAWEGRHPTMTQIRPSCVTRPQAALTLLVGMQAVSRIFLGSVLHSRIRARSVSTSASCAVHIWLAGLLKHSFRSRVGVSNPTQTSSKAVSEAFAMKASDYPSIWIVSGFRRGLVSQATAAGPAKL
jgi:hypothetical protein